MDNHCSMMLNSTTAFITGGKTESWTKETYFFDIIDWTWSKRPELNKKKSEFWVLYYEMLTIGRILHL